MYNYITDIDGIRVGHASDFNALTGCTVILFDRPAVGGVDIRGTAAGTRQMDALFPSHYVESVNAVLLAGGSSFGLNAAGGVMTYLEERGIGLDVGVAKVPIVPTAILFDLGIGDHSVRPNSEMAYQACLNASTENIKRGSVGAGTGATIGKLFGISRAMKGGLGSASTSLDTGLMVAALVAVNAFGDILDECTGKPIAGARTGTNEKTLIDSAEQIRRGVARRKFGEMSTTLGVIVTNARLSKVQAAKVAQMGHVGLGRVISPVHSVFDGDVIFAFSVGNIEANLNTVGLLGEAMIRHAVRDAIVQADGFGVIPAYKDII